MKIIIIIAGYIIYYTIALTIIVLIACYMYYKMSKKNETHLCNDCIRDIIEDNKKI